MVAPEISQRLNNNLGQEWMHRVFAGDLLHISEGLSDYMLRSEIEAYRDQLISFRDQGCLHGDSDLEKQWIKCLHLKTGCDLYKHIRTLQQDQLQALHDWIKQFTGTGGSPPTNPVQKDGTVAAEDLVDMAYEVLNPVQLVEFMAKTL